MHDQEKHIELIEKKLSGHLSETELKEFEMLWNDDGFQVLFAEQKQLHELIEGRGEIALKDEIGEALHQHKAKSRARKYWYALGLGLTLIGTGILVYNSIGEKEESLTEVVRPDQTKDIVPAIEPELNIEGQDTVESGTRKEEKIKFSDNQQQEFFEEELAEEDSIPSNETIEESKVSVLNNEDKSSDTGKKDTTTDPCEGVVIKGAFGSKASCLSRKTGVIFPVSKISGGKAPYSYILNGNIFKKDRFESLPPGANEIIIQDVNQCKSEVIHVAVEAENCPITKDAKISPSVGEEWSIPLEEGDAGRLQIFNQEGKVIVDKIAEHGETWDGTNNGQVLSAGGYTYLLKTTNGRVITGTISIIP